MQGSDRVHGFDGTQEKLPGAFKSRMHEGGAGLGSFVRWQAVASGLLKDFMCCGDEGRVEA